MEKSTIKCHNVQKQVWGGKRVEKNLAAVNYSILSPFLLAFGCTWCNRSNGKGATRPVSTTMGAFCAEGLAEKAERNFMAKIILFAKQHYESWVSRRRKSFFLLPPSSETLANMETFMLNFTVAKGKFNSFQFLDFSGMIKMLFSPLRALSTILLFSFFSFRRERERKNFSHFSSHVKLLVAIFVPLKLFKLRALALLCIN